MAASKMRIFGRFKKENALEINHAIGAGPDGQTALCRLPHSQTINRRGLPAPNRFSQGQSVKSAVHLVAEYELRRGVVT